MRFFKKSFISLGCYGKAWRNRQACVNHFPEAGILAAHKGDISYSESFKPTYKGCL